MLDDENDMAAVSPPLIGKFDAVGLSSPTTRPCQKALCLVP